MGQAGLISIIIPVYNAEKYLERCLSSVVRQTYKDIEVIIINDGSKDKSRAIAENFAEKDERIKIINKENGGVSSARNTGLSAANGEFVTYIDADDYIAEDYLEVLYAEARSTGADIICCGCSWLVDGERIEEFNTSKSRRILEHKAEYWRDVFEEKEFYQRVVWGKIIKAELAKKYSFRTDMKYGEDTYYMLDMLSSSPKTALIDYDGYYYVQTTDGAMGSAGEANPDMKMQHLLFYRFFFRQREGLPEYEYAGTINCYARLIAGAVSVCLKQKTREAYNKYQETLLSYANEVWPYKKHIQRYFKIRLAMYRRSPAAFWTLFHALRRIYAKIRRHNID